MSKIHKDSPPSVHKQIFIFRPFSSSGASESANVTKKKHPSPNLIHSLGPKLIMEVENRLLVEENGHPRGQTIHVTMFPGACIPNLYPEPPLFSSAPSLQRGSYRSNALLDQAQNQPSWCGFRGRNVSEGSAICRSKLEFWRPIWLQEMERKPSIPSIASCLAPLSEDAMFC